MSFKKKVILIASAVAAFFVGIFVWVVKVLFRKNKEIKTLNKIIDAKDKINEEYEEIENETKENIKKVNGGTVDERIANSIDVLSNLKKNNRKSSKH